MYELAKRIVEFAKDYDYYEYIGSLDFEETDEDAINKTAVELSNPVTREATFEWLMSIDAAELSDAQRRTLCNLLIDLS